LTTLRLGVGLAAAGAFLPGQHAWSNIGACLAVLSNFLDHADGELARISGKGSRLGHWYDLASDAVVTILLFVAMGIGVTMHGKFAMPFGLSAVALGCVAGFSIALIFFMRLQIEALHGKHAVQQGAIAGFETEDVLYLLPLVTLGHAIAPFLFVASIGAPLFALWVVRDYRRLRRRVPR
jgi:phosphatidylglycerophosphate synthase